MFTLLQHQQFVLFLPYLLLDQVGISKLDQYFKRISWYDLHVTGGTRHIHFVINKPQFSLRHELLFLLVLMGVFPSPSGCVAYMISLCNLA